MRTLHVVMPMAGEGSRFAREGWLVPKPLIEFDGCPLFQRSLGSVVRTGFPLKISAVIRSGFAMGYNVESRVLEAFPEANVFQTGRATSGAVETCLFAEPAILEEEAVLVIDCDLEFRSALWQGMLEQSLAEPWPVPDGGILLSFNSSDPRYSYAETDDFGIVTRTAEKEVISDHALCGVYFFSSGELFKRIAHKLLDSGASVKGECYVSLMYNYLIGEGGIVELAPVDFYRSYGTPEELKHYL